MTFFRRSFLSSMLLLQFLFTWQACSNHDLNIESDQVFNIPVTSLHFSPKGTRYIAREEEFLLQVKGDLGYSCAQILEKQWNLAGSIDTLLLSLSLKVLHPGGHTCPLDTGFDTLLSYALPSTPAKKLKLQRASVKILDSVLICNLENLHDSILVLDSATRLDSSRSLVLLSPSLDSSRLILKKIPDCQRLNWARYFNFKDSLVLQYSYFIPSNTEIADSVGCVATDTLWAFKTDSVRVQNLLRKKE